MSETVSKIGYGISLGHCATLSGTYVNLAEILDITPPPVDVDEVKVYRSDNTAAVVERVPGWTEVGDPEVTITYNPPQRAIIEALVGVNAYFKITWPLVGAQSTQGDVDAFFGFIKGTSKETPLKGAMTMKIKFAVSGAITYTEGS